MLLLLVGGIVLMLVLGAMANGVKSMTKGVDGLTGWAKKAEAALDKKIAAQKAAQKPK